MKFLFIPFLFSIIYNNPTIGRIISKCDYYSALTAVRFFGGQSFLTNNGNYLDYGNFIYQQPVSIKEYNNYCHTIQYQILDTHNLLDNNELPSFLVLPRIETMVCYK